MLEQIIERLAPYNNQNGDVKILTSVLELRFDLLRFETNTLNEKTAKALAVRSRWERAKNLEDRKSVV